VNDWELWACANRVLQHHGAGVDHVIAERIAALAAAGDAAGTKAWLAIADRVDQLRRSDGQERTRH